MSFPRPSGATASSIRTARVLLLAVALLCAQWAGMLHRIDHAKGQGDVHVHGAHACVVFDGACLADLLPTALVASPAAHMAHVRPFAIDFTSWQGVFFGHFQPRAPPAA
jgi:fumarate reductase subunit D